MIRVFQIKVEARQWRPKKLHYEPSWY